MATRKTTKFTKSLIGTTDSLMKDFTVADEKRWEDMSVEELEALSEHNQNILSVYEVSVKTVKNCQTKIKEIIRKKRHAVIMEKIDSLTPKQQFDITPKEGFENYQLMVYNYETNTIIWEDGTKFLKGEDNND